jgi:hypothetical protein
MKKTLKFLSLSLLVFCGSASAASISQSIALWEQVDRLLCVGRSGFDCSGSGCYDRGSSAVWNVDFSNNVIKIAGSDYEIKILYKLFSEYSLTNNSLTTLFMNDSRTMKFNHKRNNQLTDVIEATTTDTHYLLDDVTVAATRWECYQQ